MRHVFTHLCMHTRNRYIDFVSNEMSVRYACYNTRDEDMEKFARTKCPSQGNGVSIAFHAIFSRCSPLSLSTDANSTERQRERERESTVGRGDEGDFFLPRSRSFVIVIAVEMTGYSPVESSPIAVVRHPAKPGSTNPSKLTPTVRYPSACMDPAGLH